MDRVIIRIETSMEILYTWDGHYLRHGQGAYKPVLLTWDGKYIREGKGDYKPVRYTWDGKYLRIRKGDYNDVLYTITDAVPIVILMLLGI